MRVMHTVNCLMVMLWCVMSSGEARASSTASLRVGLNVPLSEVQRAIEDAVPRKIERLGATQFDQGWGFRYGAWRGPFAVFNEGGALRIRVRIQFAVWVCRKVSGFLGRSFCQPVASCGFGGDPLAEIELTTTVGASWTSNWSISPSVSTGSTAVRPCRMTFLNINVTDRAVGLLRSKIDEEAAKLRERLQLRALAEARWSLVQPTSLGGDQWIVWRAEAVRVGPIAFQPGALTSEAAIDLSARVVTSSTRPPRTGLPDSLVVGAGAAPKPARLELDLVASWTDLEAVLKSKFGTYQAGGNIQITLAKLSGSAGRVQLELHAAGAITGTLLASAAISYDPTTDELAVSDPQLVAPSGSLATSIAVSALESQLQARLQWKLEPLLARHLASPGGGLPSLSSSHATSIAVTSAGLEARFTIPAPPLTLSP